MSNGRSGNFDRSVAIGITFNRRHQTGFRPGQPPQFPHVMGNGLQIDLGPYRGSIRRIIQPVQGGVSAIVFLLSHHG